jgi:hypothetical protein
MGLNLMAKVQKIREGRFSGEKLSFSFVAAVRPAELLRLEVSVGVVSQRR